jgi:hypothetical protein
MRNSLALLLSLSLGALPCPSIADVPVRNGTNLVPRVADKDQSSDSKAKKTGEIEERRSVNCNISQKERNRRLYNSSSTLPKNTMSRPA